MTCSSSGRARPVSLPRSTRRPKASTSSSSKPRLSGGQADRHPDRELPRLSRGHLQAGRGTRLRGQAQKFGAEILIAQGATRPLCDRTAYVVETNAGTRVSARAVVIATGAEYRRLPLDTVQAARRIRCLLQRDGSRSATYAQRGIIVGGRNSAARPPSTSPDSGACPRSRPGRTASPRGVSRSLIRRIETPTSRSTLARRSSRFDGKDRLEHVQWRDMRTGETSQSRHRQCLRDRGAGASPNTGWLTALHRARRTWVRQTGPALSVEDLREARWPQGGHRFSSDVPPGRLIATAMFHSGSVNGRLGGRDGSITVSFVHRCSPGRARWRDAASRRGYADLWVWPPG